METDAEPNIFCVAGFKADPQKWLNAIIEKKFIYDDGKWNIDGIPLPNPRRQTHNKDV